MLDLANRCYFWSLTKAVNVGASWTEAELLYGVCSVASGANPLFFLVLVRSLGVVDTINSMTLKMPVRGRHTTLDGWII